VCAVVVTFDPDEELMRGLTIVREQVDGLVVVDNSLSASRREVVAQAVAATGATLVSNPQNLGIAAALNQGASRALESGYEWLLMLDQDTWPEPFMIDELARAYQACPFRDRLAIVDSAVPETQSYAYCRGRSWAEQEAVITSGSLLRLEAFQRGGPFREDFFIDYVDLEYCLRMRSLGYRVILTCRPTMQHHIGHPRRHRLVYRDVTPTHHSRPACRCAKVAAAPESGVHGALDDGRADRMRTANRGGVVRRRIVNHDHGRAVPPPGFR
jgi:rhamnosyltransferase